MDKWGVVKAFTLGSLLEVAVPKPGNVNRYRDFEDLTLYHFLFAHTAVIDVLFEAAEKGEFIRKGKISPADAGIGALIRKAVENSRKAQNSNPNFGIITLEIPLITAITWAGSIDAREEVKKLIACSSPQDSIEFYKAIRTANPKGIKTGVKYDVYDDASFEELLRDEINLKKLAEISSERELIFREWLTGYRLSYSTFYRFKELTSTLSLEEATVRVFLELLSNNIDTLIVRKAGPEEAELVQKKAREVLAGKLTLEEFDEFLREKKDLRNPGSLADIMAISLSLLILSGYSLNL
ncbi:apo-citrate lyase phosphoribosyl-dephospho-CoA transferase [Thermococcus bergensis]|uniref:triphosphoribosyl-dephospho-CoA synthase n=1 Tax=Thermococcus bergensis TaxID=2689387 RepID=UPI001CED08BE|nr:triphosphoribosyl-dephospho-CoA synthase [Thermococcus bergensis]MCA6212961.1 apo-citrate lyase phosphoribosyl-dephospho-CoA transferase [Thermococcus bergensis]